MRRITFRSVALILLIVSIPIILFGFDDCEFCYSGPTMLLKLLTISLIIIAASFYYFYKWFVMDSILFKVERQPLAKIGTITKDTPISFQGKIGSDLTLTSPYTKTKCVFYHYIKERYVSSGDSSHWQVQENECNYVNFKVSDDTGSIYVDLRNIDSFLGDHKIVKGDFEDRRFIDYSHSELDARKLIFQKRVDFKEKSLLGFNRNVKQRISEYVLVPGQEVFVYGWAYEEGGDKVVAESVECPLIVSRKTKEEYLQDFAVGQGFFYSHNLLLFLGLSVLYFSLKFLINLHILFFYLILILISSRMIIQAYNRIIFLRNRMKNSKSQIDIELKKRADLIPLLEKVVKSYRNYEAQIIKGIALLRSEIYSDANGMKKYLEDEPKLDKQLILLTEKYPKLKSNENFLDFMNRLSGIEENIAYYRGFYNKTVLKYNTLISVIPFSLLAYIFRFKKQEYFILDDKQPE